jgi:transcriptional regulator with XRE-family HTH domain
MLNLRFFRLRAGFSQRELAERIGVHQPRISMWECGLEVAPHYQEKLYGVLLGVGVLPDGFTPTQLLEETNGGGDDLQRD